MSLPVSVFLFAHQDDEFGVFDQIREEVALGRRVVCAYLTSGVPAGGNPAQRDGESVAVLAQLGVSAADIVFAGAQLGIADGSLMHHLPVADRWLQQWLPTLGEIAAVYVLAWEGGHPDHDALHAVSLLVCDGLDLLARTHQFALYNAYRCPWQFFRLLSPLAQNGVVSRRRIAWAQRLHYMRLALSYPSQRGTWLGLFPFFVLHCLFHGGQDLQPASTTRMMERPHSGPLYYENRRFATWAQMQAAITAWLAGRIP